MPRFLTLVLLSLLSVTSFSQIKISTTEFNGKLYKVYPVRLPIEPEGYYSYSRRLTKKAIKKGLWESYSTDELLLPFNPFNLDNGDYIIYYEKRELKYDKETRQPIYTHEDTTLVAATFSIVNNKKEGQATWYDFGKGQQVLQTGYYKSDLKSGEWNRIRKNHKVQINYSEGLLHGNYARFYKGELRRIGQYKNDEAVGIFKQYYTKKPSQIYSTTTYDQGSSIDYKQYDKKGNIRHWESDSFKDNIAKKSFDNGRISKTVSKLDSFGGNTTVQYDDDGSISRKFYKVKFDHYDFYTDESKIVVRHKATPRWAHFQSFIKDYYYGNKSAYEEFYSNGQLRISYDLRKDTLVEPIKEFDKKGRLLKSMQLDSSNSEFLITKEYDPKSSKIVSTWISYQGSGRLLSVDFDKNGDTTRYVASPYYLSEKHKNKRGLILCKKSFYKKNKTVGYNLLHTDKIFESTWYKDVPKTLVATKKIRFASEDSIRITLTEFDKNHITAIEHSYIFKKPTYDKDHYLKKSSYLDAIEPDIINELKDTLTHVLYGFNQNYSGDVVLKGRYKYKKHFNHKAKVKVNRYKINGIVFKDTSLKIVSYREYIYDENELEYSDGIPDKIEQGYSYVAEYVNGLKNGEGNDESGYKGYYVRGQRHGLYKNYRTFMEYYKGKQHGLEMHLGYYGSDKRYNDQIAYKTTFVMDTLHGLFQSFVAPEVVGQSVQFIKGYPHGEYFRGNLTCPVSVKAQLHHGYLVDTASYYFKEGILKAKVNYELSDSVSYSGWVLQPVTGQSGRWPMSTYGSHSNGSQLLDETKIIEFKSNQTADYQYFYKNGQMASEGRIERRQKVGTWKYWDLNGQLYKEISYDTGWHINPITKDSIKYYGKVKMWYPNGKKLLTGLVKYNEYRFKCDQEMQVSFENLHYLSFFNEAGEQLISNGSGPIKEYHNNGEIRIEGHLKNNKPFGLWKYYDPNGRLEKMGSFDENGLKNGMWVEGDLEAVPYYEKFCRAGAVDAYNFPDVDQIGYVTQKINIKQYHYVNGEQVREETTSLLPLY